MAAMRQRSAVSADVTATLLAATAALLIVVGGAVPTAAQPSGQGVVDFFHVEGRVVAVERTTGPNGLDLLEAEIEVDTEPARKLRLLLAPPGICEQIGFAVDEGDLLRARVFAEGTGVHEVQKVSNLSRGTMVRLRTMRHIPLWSASGSWYGGEMRTGPGPHRVRARGGRREGDSG